MRRITLVLAFLCWVPLMAQEAPRPVWTDKNNTQMSAAYMLQHSYFERGYMGAHVKINRVNGRDVYTVVAGPLYHFRDVNIAGLVGNDLHLAMQDAPKAGDVYSAARVNAWIADVEGRLGKVSDHRSVVQVGEQLFDRSTASVNLSLRFE